MGREWKKFASLKSAKVKRGGFAHFYIKDQLNGPRKGQCWGVKVKKLGDAF